MINLVEILILISNLTWIPWKSLNSPPQSAILRDFLKSGIPIYNSKVPVMAVRRKTQAIAKRFAFHANAIPYENKNLGTVKNVK